MNNTKEPYLTVSYLRVSTIKQREEETIETQRFVLQNYADTNGITIDRQFEDDGVSGGIEIHKRPEGSELYNLISTGTVKRLLLFHSDRVGRDTVDTLLFHRHAEINGTQILGIADGTDTSREGSKLMTEIKAVIAAEYRRDCSRRTTAGLRRRAAAGKISTAPPFGYKVEDGFLVIDEDKASVVKRIFTEYASGRKTVDIISDLNNEERLSPRGNGWRHDTMIYILKQRAYIGEFIQFRTPRKKSLGVRIPRPKSEQIISPCPAIVSNELFDAAQEQITFNRKFNSTSQKRTYLLKGIMRCARCGLTYIGHAIVGRKHKDKQYPDFIYYECATLTKLDYKYCGSPRVNAKKIETMIWNEIESFILNPSNVIKQLVETFNRLSGKHKKEESHTLKRIEKKKSENKQARERLALAFAKGLLSEEEITKTRENLLKELHALDQEETRIRQRAEAEANEKKQLLNTEAMLQTLQEQVEKGFSPDKKMAIIRQLVREATVKANDKNKAVINVQYVFLPNNCFVPVGSGFNDSSRKK